MMDFSRTTTDQLKRSLKFHDNDISTMTVAEECRRMAICDGIRQELKRRGETEK